MSIDWLDGVIYPYFNFFVFVILAVLFLKRPLNQFVLKKREDYERLSQENKKTRGKLEKRQVILQKRLDQLDQEIVETKKAALLSAKAAADNMIQDTKHFCENIQEDAKNKLSTEFFEKQALLEKELIYAVQKEVYKQFQNQSDDKIHQQIIEKKIKLITTLL